jgi:ribonuclease HII
MDARHRNGTRPGLKHERDFARKSCRLVAGLDEVGRGAWAGPVVAAAVILNLKKASSLRKVRDSKQLSPRQRDALFPVIQAACHTWGLGLAGADEIDAIGIVAATRLAMRRAIETLSPAPDALIIDALRLPDVDLPQRAFPFADSISLSVAAASILAKVTRDRMMMELDAVYPYYGFDRHKGYGTPAHRTALVMQGACRIHRMTFKPLQACITNRAHIQNKCMDGSLAPRGRATGTRPYTTTHLFNT